VTHNHEDALFLAASLAIMIDGKIEQRGKTEEIFEKPKTPFIKRLLTPYSPEMKP
jgi:ABC-type Fe3+/spermidine/putrescine transport system ATPase subunit